MGQLLREVLKYLCGVNQWSYAIFWKIGCQNPKLLIWEECYYEPRASLVPAHSWGTENSVLPYGECDGHWGSRVQSLRLGMQSLRLGMQGGDKVHLLVNRMMMNNQVNVVGEGIIGRAAFTGNHEWILSNNYTGNSYPPEVLNEVHHQFSAGMQTIAVIPVCPHGVLQFGSSVAIMENMGFVNNVRTLILQLGCVPGALFSDNHTVQDSTERIGIPISIGNPISVHLTGNQLAQQSIPSAESFKQQTISSQAARIVGHRPTGAQVGQIQANPQHASATFHNPNLTKTLSESCSGSTGLKVNPLIKQDDSLRRKFENGVLGAQVIPTNPDIWLSQQSTSQNTISGFSNQPLCGQSDSNSSFFTSLEQRIFPESVTQNQICNNTRASNHFPKPYMSISRGQILNSYGDSYPCGSGIDSGVSNKKNPSSVSYSLLNSQKAADVTQSSGCFSGVELHKDGSSKPEEVPLSRLVEQLSAGSMRLSDSDSRCHSTDKKHIKTESSRRMENIDHNLLQGLNLPVNQADEDMLFHERILVSGHDCPTDTSGSQSTITGNSKYETLYPQPPAGDDLYDILGLDFKKKLLNGKWNNLMEDGACANTQNMEKDASTLMNMQETSSDFNSVHDGMQDSGIFSVMSTDHLLDAVVSSAQSSAKKSLDGNASCGTTLSKLSSSSIPSSTPTYGGRINMPDQAQRILDLPKSVEKVGPVASSSFKSGSSKDDTGSCSQITTIYGSQLSSWVDQHMKGDTSVSTALSKKNDETKPNRKRLKPGENPRPRPKDRQMIQDRVKELREIVPNGAKCSIDALLERTIKHMLFLQSVTKHADKLKQTGESKIINKDGGLLLKDNFEGGATWAFEVGSQSMVCPIIVEDLNPPRQMLVEMLCEERGFFLEIADLIRGLGLTILKGVMEARNDKIWARFAVEANRDVTRVEIFMSLVRLLEQTVKGSSTSSANALEDNMMVHHALSQATSIPATGRPSSLQ